MNRYGEDEIENAGEKARSEILFACKVAGVDHQQVGELLAGMLKGEIKSGDGQLTPVSPRIRAFALERYLELNAAIPERRKKVDVMSEQRVISLTLGRGDLPRGIDLDKLNQLPPEKKRQALALLKEVLTDDPAALALPNTEEGRSP